jgi:CRP/FNR family cyclic AMP-dependent transcriptional regulator
LPPESQRQFSQASDFDFRLWFVLFIFAEPLALMNSKKNHPFLIGMTPEYVDLILQGAKEAEYGANDLLISEGEPANEFFLIDSGLVALERGGSGKVMASIQTIGAGEALGWSWLFPPFTWHFRARAVEPTRATILNGGHLLVLCEENHGLGYDVMRRIAQIVISRMEAASKKLWE